MFTKVLLSVLISIGTETVSMASISLPNILKPQAYVNVTLNDSTPPSQPVFGISKNSHPNIHFKPATHLAILYADRGEFERQRNDFRPRLMGTHLAIFFADRGDVAVSKSHVIKSPNLMGWLYVENRGNKHTWRMPANLIADI